MMIVNFCTQHNESYIGKARVAVAVGEKHSHIVTVQVPDQLRTH